MTMRILLAILWLTLATALCPSQTGSSARNDDKGTYLGVLFAPPSEEQYKRWEQLPRGQGVRVTRVLADSPAAKAGLQRDDLVLEYNGQKVKDCLHFANLIIGDKPNQQVKLTFLRDGKENTVEATLTQRGSGTSRRSRQRGH